MVMADFISGMVAGAVFLWAVQYVVALVLQRHMDQQIAELEQLIRKSRDQENVTARVEEVDGCFYVYNAKTGEFLAQGRTLVEMDLVLKQRWPDRMVYVAEGEGDAVQRLKATQ